MAPDAREQQLADVAPLGNPDGVINAADYLIMTRAVLGEIVLSDINLGVTPPQLIAGNNAPNANPYLVSGSATPGTRVSLYVNGGWQRTVVAKSTDGSYQFTVYLFDGENAIQATQWNGSLESYPSTALSANYANDIGRQQSGTLSGTVVWTPGEPPQPYVVNSSLTVLSGSTLILQPGTVLEFDANTALSVDGRIDTRGDIDNPVVFTSSQPSPVAGDWSGIQLRKNGSFIQNAVIEYAVTAVSVDDTNNVTIADNLIRQFSYRGILVNNGYAARINNNRIDNEDLKTGAGIEVRSSLPSITGNTIQNADYGIYVNGGSVPEISMNTVRKNNSGLVLQSSSQIGYGSQDPNPIVSGNNLYGNLDYNLYAYPFQLNPDTTLEMSGNYWARASPTAVSQLIYDRMDSVSAPNGSPLFNFQPFPQTPVPVGSVPVPSLDLLPGLTNIPTVAVSGQAGPGSLAHIYVHDRLQSTVAVSPAGDFLAGVPLTDGQNVVYATLQASNLEGLPSNLIDITLDRAAPVISITSPSLANAYTANPVFSIEGSVDEPVTLSVNGNPVTLAADLSFISAPLILTEGPNQISVSATDSAGNTSTVQLNPLLDTQAPASIDTAGVTLGPLTSGMITITGGAGSAPTGERLTLVNARTGTSVSLVPAADGSFTALLDVAPGDRLMLLATDAAGNTSDWSDVIVPGSSMPLTLTITAPSSDAVIDTDRVNVSGPVQGPGNPGVVVNNIVATVRQGRFYAHNVPLQPGANTLTATVVTADGQYQSDSITVTAAVDRPFNIHIVPASGAAPLQTAISVEETSVLVIKRVEVDFDGDGTIDFRGDKSRLPANYTYAMPGLYTVSIRVIDSTDAAYTYPAEVIVEDPLAGTSQVVMVYKTLLNRLASQNIAGALDVISGSSREKYQGLFTLLQVQLPTLVPTFGVIRSVSVNGNQAEIEVVRQKQDGKYAYYITLIRDQSGVWRIEDM